MSEWEARGQVDGWGRCELRQGTEWSGRNKRDNLETMDTHRNEERQEDKRVETQEEIEIEIESKHCICSILWTLKKYWLTWPEMHNFGRWEEAGVPVGSPRKHANSAQKGHGLESNSSCCEATVLFLLCVKYVVNCSFLIWPVDGTRNI